MADVLTQAQMIECFHLAFVAALFVKLDRKRVVLKGGANLRYFFGSHRYSEDIDFDVVDVAGWQLVEKLDAVLGGPALGAVLSPQAITVERSNHAEGSDTTHRWKVGLKAPGHRQVISTKIEFSLRNGDHRLSVDAVPDDLVARYALRPASIRHYQAAPATEQKIYALAGRRQTQARDVFDLELLFRTQRGAVAAGALPADVLNKAHDRCLALTYDEFESQVLPFLEPELVDLYETADSWADMQLAVAHHLDALE